MKYIPIILLLLYPQVNYAQQSDTVFVSGKVLDEDGEPIPGVLVRLWYKQKPDTYTFINTDFDGNFKSPIIRKGISGYEIQCRYLPPYIDTTYSINLATIKEGKLITIIMRRDPNFVDPEAPCFKSFYENLLQKHNGTNKTFSGEDFDRMAY